MNFRIYSMARNVLGTTLQPCSMDPITGFTRSGSCVGRIDRVGSDHLDVVPAYGWGERGARDTRCTTVPFSAIASVAESA